MSESQESKIRENIEENTNLAKVNNDIARIKEEQLKELSNDSNSQSQKTQQLLGFFGAVSAILFSQDGLKEVHYYVLVFIFVLIVAFIITCLLSFQGKKVQSMVSLSFGNYGEELRYIDSKINQIELCKNSLKSMIEYRNNLNNIASFLFMALILIYSFIFLIHNPMTEQNSGTFKGSDLQIEQTTNNQPKPISISKPPLPSQDQPQITIKTLDPSKGNTHTE